MRQRNSVVLFSTLLSLKYASAATLPRGVGPEFVKFYESQKTFSCIGHPEIKLSSSQVNDNSCDCPDGSDEPGTAACAYLDTLSPPQPLPGSLSGSTNTSNALPGFWCSNAGHLGAYVPFMYVNDGVCDYDVCCDGSEEYSGVGGVKCPNKCAEIGREFRRVEEERKKALEKSARKRKTMAKESKELRRRVEARISSLKEEIKQLEVKRDDLQKRYEEVERQEKGKIVKNEGAGGKLGVLMSLAKSRVTELRDALDKVIGQRDDLEDRVEELEAILRKFKEEYNPNFNDEGVKQAVKSWEDYAAKSGSEQKIEVDEDDLTELLKEDSINWKEFEEEEVTDTDILYNLEAYLPGFLRDYLRGKLLSLRVWMIENGILADNQKPGSESVLVTSAREARDNAASDLMNKQRMLADEELDLTKDYGADDIFRALKGKCISTDSGEYEYELCWLDSTSQKSKKGHGNTNMGNFAKIDREMADDEERQDGKGLGRGMRMVLRYENGQGCWNGPQRRTDVWLACSEIDELWKVSESEKCVYKMEVGTPAACDELLQPPEPAGKDEL